MTHGLCVARGEPLIWKADLYHDIEALQERIFGAAYIEFTNSVQKTNLTVLNDDVLGLCRTFFEMWAY